MSPHKHCSFVCVLPTWYIVKGSDRWQNITPYVSMSGSWATWRLAADEVIFHLLWVSLWLCVRLCRSHLKRMNHQTNKKQAYTCPRRHAHTHTYTSACAPAFARTNTHAYWIRKKEAPMETRSRWSNRKEGTTYRVRYLSLTIMVIARTSESCSGFKYVQPQFRMRSSIKTNKQTKNK